MIRPTHLTPENALASGDQGAVLDDEASGSSEADELVVADWVLVDGFGGGATPAVEVSGGTTPAGGGEDVEPPGGDPEEVGGSASGGSATVGSEDDDADGGTVTLGVGVCSASA